MQKTEDKVKPFEREHGNGGRAELYGEIDDMELLEWEGEIEVRGKLREPLASLDEITIEDQ